MVQRAPVYTARTGPQGAAPRFNIFPARPTSCGVGGNVTVAGDVSNGPYVIVSPQAGAVRGISVTVHPGQTTTYKLYATNQYGRTTATVTVTVP